MGRRVYLDWNATAPLRPEARAAMAETLDLVGNPSSVHAEGRAARAAVERARAEVAALVQADPAEVVFTASATEAAVSVLALDWAQILISDLCHDALALSLPQGAATAWLPAPVLLEAGAAQIDQALSGPPGLLALPAAEGETGLVPPFGAWADAARSRGWRVLLDATQLIGRGLPFAFAPAGAPHAADYAVLSAHKLGGPKGAAALLMRTDAPYRALLTGGGQELGRRSGTENVPAIAGFGAAASAVADEGAAPWARVAELRNILEITLDPSRKSIIFVGNTGTRLPNTTCIVVPGWRGETQVMQMDLAGFAVSAGAACSSGKVRASRVLTALGYDAGAAASAIRVSLGPETVEDDVAQFAEAWRRAYSKFQTRAA